MSLSQSAPVLPDLRQTQIVEWLTTLSSNPTLPATLRPASADASFRRYFRVDVPAGGTLIVMDAPPPQEDVRPFIEIGALFGGIGLSVPAVLAQDVERGFLLLSDLGNTTYLQQLTSEGSSIESAHKLYMDAIDALVLLQTKSQPDVLPEYDRAFLLRELQIFPEWYLGKHLKATLSDQQSADLNKVFDAILANNLAQPQVFIHRDYHSRNLMVLAEGNPGVLDFQGALYGPISYDIVSLLRDVYIQRDEAQVLDWMIRYWERAKRAGLPVAPDIDSFYRDFEYMGLQRHLKILGLFARLYHRDGKDAYLNDIPVVMDYVRKTALRYRELIPLVRMLDKLEDKTVQVGYTF
ncbi:phosphotransferase enzyme family protein [Collimonas arenae]|uniref:Phosphotransferase enzyme family protein n=1 Tax=Collimonas arenae TaxID=279058 RepID=A0A127QNG5_9BURK|nr:phosphotransferase [Collimonas arenae]AMP01434.1 phosphotransferase enzyme family protein [Collimonas arenae]AMP11335.1 phosphotransferase enzyme family protein [Collimonas arenae]